MMINRGCILQVVMSKEKYVADVRKLKDFYTKKQLTFVRKILN